MRHLMKHHHEIVHHSPSSTLHVIAVVSNPVAFKSRYVLFKQFQAVMALHDVNLIVVEMAFGARQFEVTNSTNPNHVQVRGKDELWHKENLINLGFARLPDDWEYAAWVDGDIEFMNPEWVHDTLNALQHYKIVQMFQNCIDTGPDGSAIQTHTGFGYQYITGQIMKPEYTFWHPGYAWAIRRDAFNAIGRLIDYAILGAADHHMALAFVGNVKNSMPGGIHKNYSDALYTFQDRCERLIKRDVGYVPGIICHAFHGKKKDRKYVERWDIITKHDYDPLKDIKYGYNGVLQLEDNKPEFRDAIRNYFRQRNEDSVDLESTK